MLKQYKIKQIITKKIMNKAVANCNKREKKEEIKSINFNKRI